MTTPSVAQPAQHAWLASGVAVLIATAFAAGSTLARLAYDGGSNALTVTTVRTVVAALLILNGRLFGPGDTRPRTLHMLVAAAVANLAVCLVADAFAPPVLAIGWIGLAGTTVSYSFAFISLFMVIAALGAVRVALILHIEPVLSMILG